MSNLTYGKIFQSMFTGSMCGAGAHVYAVMSYVISFMQPDKDRVEHVRLQVSYLSKVIGEKEEVIQKAIDFLCKKDPKSNSPEAEGRRLVPEGGFNYWVVNGRYYRELKDEDDRRRKDAERSARYRERKKAASRAALPDHHTAERLAATHGQEAAERLADHQARELEDIQGERAADLNGQ